jgi:outer membrane protein with beta-barrel domain
MKSQRVVVSGLVASLVLSSAALAQHQSLKTRFGVLGGAAFDKPGGADTQQIDGSYTGFAVGGFVGLQLTPGFAIEPEALYVQKGIKLDATAGNTKVKVPYFEIPVLAKLRIPAKGQSIVSPHIYAGPALAFKVGCHVKGTGSTGTISEPCDATGIDVRIKSTDFSLTFGGGVDVGRAIIDVRYDLGLSKFSDNPSGNNDAKHRTIYLLAGWTFGAPS